MQQIPPSIFPSSPIIRHDPCITGALDKGKPTSEKNQ
jgi:hypothetical protein